MAASDLLAARTLLLHLRPEHPLVLPLWVEAQHLAMKQGTVMTLEELIKQRLMQNAPALPRMAPASTPDPQLLEAILRIAGLMQPGNIDLYNRPEVSNPDGRKSTVRSMSFNDAGREILVPTAADNRILSEEEAIDRFYRTREHLGMFDTPDNATAYAKRLHEDYEAGKYNKP